MFDVEKVGEWINEAGAKNTMWYDNITTLADKITIEQQEKMSKIADEHISIMIKASCTSDKIKSYEMLMEYLNKQLETLRGN